MGEMENCNVVALAGGTGFTGRRVAARLASGGAGLRCLVRATSDTSVLPEAAATSIGDLGDAAGLDEWLRGTRTLVYVASMGFGHIPAVLDVARRCGVERAVFVSTTGIFTRLPAPSKAVRIAAEEAVMKSGLAWTIVRPTMIYGAPGDRNIERLIRLVARRRCVPVPGNGEHLVQPVHVDDLAAGIVAASRREAAIGKAYALSGAEPLSLNATIDAAATAVGRRVRRIHCPLRPVARVLGMCEAIGLRLPIKREQILRLAEDKAFDHDDAARDLAFAPRPFTEGVSAEARLLRCTTPGGDA